MSLRLKILLLTGFTLLALLSVIYLVSRQVLIRDFKKLEHREVMGKNQRMHEALQQIIESIDKLCRDWSAWDDTYDFAVNPTRKYLDDNMNVGTLTNLKLNYIFYVDPKGRLIYQQGFDPEQNRIVPVDSQLSAHVLQHPQLWTHTDLNGLVKGIVVLSRVPLILVSRPIISSNYQGPIHGALINARVLGPNDIARIARIAGVDLEIKGYDIGSLSGEYSAAVRRFTPADSFIIKELSPRQIAGYNLVRDIYGQPAAVFKISLARDIYQQGRTSLIYWLTMLSLTGLAFGALILLILEAMVLSPLSRLHHSVEKIGQCEDLKVRISTVGHDEIASLSRAINGMLENLDHSQQRIEDSESRYRAVVEQSLNGILLIDPQTKTVIEVNTAFVGLVGRSRSDLIGHSAYELDIMSRGATDQTVASIMNDGQSVYRVFQYRQGDGAARYAEASFNLMNYQGRDVVCGVFCDITEKKLAEDLLRRSRDELERKVQERTADLARINQELSDDIRARMVVEAQLKESLAAQQQLVEKLNLLGMAIEQLDESMVITDCEGNIQYVNPAFEAATGYCREEAVGRNHSLWRSGKHDDQFYREMWQSLREGEIWRGSAVNRKKDGTLYEEGATISPVRNDAGKIVNYVAVSRDITERKRLQSIAEAVNTMNNIGYVFSGIRHEIGNALNSLKMANSIIKGNLRAYSPDTLMKFIDIASSEIARMEYLLNSLKNFSMYESPKIEPVEMPEFIKKLMALAVEDFKNRGIAIREQVDPGVARVLADPRALQQVMLNLLSNSADALTGREAPQITITVSMQKDLIQITVEDNGGGMSPEQLANLFKPFHTSKPSGTGLGLVITRNILAKMSGTIEVESQLEKGTRVAVSLPGAGAIGA
ncbi:MAG: PAS domain S-box protein [Candidatus Edwardsbacteria bacterium]|nr:PAS domain S-box protein [Candidatus Edwardsbacteria bacterium]